MKLIHCADLHLDARMESSLPKEKAKERRLEILRTFTKMTEQAAADGVSAVLLCGDLFDARSISARARNCVLDAVRQNPQITFYYLQGNHDQNSFLTDLEEMPENLKTFGSDWTTYEQDGVFITGAEITDETADGLLERLILEKDRVNIVMLHGMVTEYGAGKTKEGFSLRALRGKNIDYLALGHVHSYRQEKLDDRGCWCYCGCLEGRGFDECGEKGYVELEIEISGGDAAPSPLEGSKVNTASAPFGNGVITASFVPFAERALHEIPVDISGLEGQEEIQRAVKERLTAVPNKDMVKIVLTGEVSPEAEKDAGWIEKWLENEYYFLKVKDETRLLIRPEDYQYDVSLKGEFVRLVLASRMSKAEKEQVLRLGIRALAGEE